MHRAVCLSVTFLVAIWYMSENGIEEGIEERPNDDRWHYNDCLTIMCSADLKYGFLRTPSSLFLRSFIQYGYTLAGHGCHKRGQFGGQDYFRTIVEACSIGGCRSCLSGA